MVRRSSGRPVVAVIGGGISGLAAARVLAGGQPASAAWRDESGPGGGPGSARDPADIGSPNGTGRSARSSEAGHFDRGDLEVILLEADSRLGGKVFTGSVDGRPVELGPDQFLRRDDSAEQLCHVLGLGPRLHVSGAPRAAVYSYGELRPFPPGLALGVPTDLAAVANSGIVSEDGIWRASLDAFLPGPVLSESDVGLDGGDDPHLERSAGSLLRARFGDEVVDRLIDPLLGGINGGTLDSLSLGTVAPQIARALVGHHGVAGPLARALVGHHGVAGPLARSFDAPRPSGTPAAARGRAISSPFFGLEGGLGQIIAGVAAELADLGADVRTSTPVTALEAGDRTFGLATPTGRIDADAVVLAVPGQRLSRLLEVSAPDAAATLREIRYSSVVVVTFVYDADADAVGIPPGLSGFVVPRVEGRLATAATFLSEKWPWMRPEGESIIRVSTGRSDDDRAARLDDRALVAALGAELRELAGIDATPRTVQVTRWVGAFPQYLPGHAARVARLRADLGRHRGLSLAGALLGGIGVPACITSGEGAAAELQTALA